MQAIDYTQIEDDSTKSKDNRPRTINTPPAMLSSQNKLSELLGSYVLCIYIH